MSRKRLLLIILIVASVATHFAFFGHPNQVVFDEVHFGKFVSAYYNHQYYFDIHPPLGKLLIAGFAKIFNFHPEYSFAQIGQAFPDRAYLALRFLPILAGTLLPIVIFLLALELGMASISAFLAGMLVILDNALLTQSRYILLDPFLLLFGFLALLFYLRYRKSQTSFKNLFLMGIFAGLAVSIKWTGLAFLGLAGLVELISAIKNLFTIRTIRYSLVASGKLILYFVLIPLLVYFSIFVVHFSLLTKSGDGDAFMTPEFRATLVGAAEYENPSIKPLNTFEKFIELNKEMYSANQTLTATHPYGSKWYTWPLMIRPIYYWNASASTTGAPYEEKIYFIGNPFIWWGTTVAVLYLLIISLRNFKFKILNSSLSIPAILLAGYAINFLPFIGINRVMFLYHYLSGLIFAILMLAYCIDKTKNPTRNAIIVLSLCLITFLYFAPLSYGLPLSPHAFDNHLWLKSWQ